MKYKALLIIILIAGFVGVRVVGPTIFYDPLIVFFHSAEYYNNPLPQLHVGWFTFSLTLRYAINTILTLAMVYVLFQKKDLLKLTSYIYLGVFLVLAPVLLGFVFFASGDEYRYLFYIRRILIHPVLTLILIPAFLYNERMVATKKKL